MAINLPQFKSKSGYSWVKVGVYKSAKHSRKKKSFTANTYIYYAQNEKMRAKIITAKRRAAVGVPGGETIN